MSESPAPAMRSLRVRNATAADTDAVAALTERVYGPKLGYTTEMLLGQIARFPEGQLVAEAGGQVVAYSASFRIAERLAMAPHDWVGITGGGFASRHDVRGDWLYGMESCVDPAFRNLRIGRRFYQRRRELCEDLNLKGVVFAGRVPGFRRWRRRHDGSIQDYVDEVRAGAVRDRALTFQLRNGFELVGILPGYLPSDRDSEGFAAHLAWRNPRYRDASTQPGERNRLPDAVRVATIQYQQRRVASFEEFATQVEFFVETASDYRADFTVFPELFTLQLLSVENRPLSPADSLKALTSYTGRFQSLLAELAMRYNTNIIGGSHPTIVEDGDVHNICYVALRDGSIHTQEKIHITPNERNWWGIKGGDLARVINTDCGPIGVLICYDSEFPELARHLVDQGAQILFVPFCTDTREGYLRVRYSCHARTIENQCYAVLSGNVGNLPGVNNFDIQYAQSCILSPCDFPFARDGIAADTTPNVEQVAFADLRLDTLAIARSEGTVQNLKDRRHDLYQVRWRRR
ncbi:MAG: carbon-nitrogen hydrolase family protein [Pseudoxanthomonas sp.]|nr:carbon-nitrogen hydrolase family protein [Pseudoxanthomonas sp.]